MMVGKKKLGDVELGEKIVGRSITIGEWHVMTFAGLTGDFYPLHTDAEFAAGSPFSGRIAHGLLTFVVGAGFLANELADYDVVAALGFGATRFTSPVMFGDTITPTGTVTEVAPKEGRGVVAFDIDITNQRGETVVSSSMQVMIRA
ncbi:MaoC family dehydratase [Euzebya rosea]|uniref:MaoC family dehydratase n=1 Tax=Euzebya rosea TaxID=2052804 RepID=UPI000D3EA694|nr:MaoC/PaaZ C-terminal domain-containing protein [Euzebya rosea]